MKLFINLSLEFIRFKIKPQFVTLLSLADVVELVDTVDSKSAYSNIVLVRVQSSAHH